MKYSNEENLTLYERKYGSGRLLVPRGFKREFTCLLRQFAPRFLVAPGKIQVIDLGGGTGEYSLALSELGYNATCFDFSEAAIAKARQLGVRAIDADFYTYPFEPAFHIAFARGFSCLNTDVIADFKGYLARIQRCLLPDGVVLYWANSDLSGAWTASHWYNLSLVDLDAIFGPNHYLLLPRLRYQAFLPAGFNRWLDHQFCRRNHRPLSPSYTVFAAVDWQG